METEDDREFTTEEIRQTIMSIDHKKAPGEDGITSRILMWTYESFPRLMTSLHNGCSREGCFPKMWKRARSVPLIKPRKENCNDASKYRPISLLNVGGKVLEKLLINRIMHFLHSNGSVNQNQFGFLPQRRSTTDEAMAVKDFVEEAPTKGQIVTLASLYIKGAFDAACWPSILQALKEFQSPRNLYNLTNNYFCERSAFISTNSIRIDTTVNRGCPQGSCCGPGYWNIQCNSLLNLNFEKWTRAIAFADDLLIAVKAATVEVENFTNMEMKKITKWSKDNKLHFNDQKSKFMLISRRRKERKAIDIYLNNNHPEQVDKIKYLGIIIDSIFKFNEHIKYITDRCTKLINALSKSARIN